MRDSSPSVLLVGFNDDDASFLKEYITNHGGNIAWTLHDKVSDRCGVMRDYR
jgi:hypothetical protein